MIKDLTYKAMLFAKDKHKNQKRKYTNQPYFCHLSEVAGIVSTVLTDPISLSIAWLHDTLEDTETVYEDLINRFGLGIAYGVYQLTDSTLGNRKERKEKDRDRISKSDDYIQTVKVADMISNSCSIFDFDPDFAKVYGQEKRLMLSALSKADRRLVKIADDILVKHGF